MELQVVIQNGENTGYGGEMVADGDSLGGDTDVQSPSNKLLGYYPASLLDDKNFSPVGVIDSSPVLQRRVKLVARFSTPGTF
jgi:hypothetical protein